MFTWTYEDHDRVLYPEKLKAEARQLGLEVATRSLENELGGIDWTVSIESDDDTDACAFHDAMTALGYSGLLRMA